MTHELILQAIKIKTTIFNPPARLINYKELSCAIGLAFRQAGLPLPETKIGEDIKELRDESLKALEGNAAVDQNVRTLIENYLFQPGEVMDEDALITMKLGYGNV